MTPRRGSWSGLAPNLLLSLVSLLLACGALELVARALSGGRDEPAEATRGYVEFDPLLGWRHKPGARVALPQGDYEINSLGLRDRERSHQAAPGVFRLLLLGDSFAEGFSVPFQDSVASVLERSLSPAGCPLEVIAAGTVGYSTDQEYLFYREEGIRYSPHVVLLLFYYNDIVYNARESLGRAPKPLLSFKGGVPRVKNHPLVEPAAGALQVGAPAPRGSAALAFAAERLLAAAPRGYDALASLGLWPKRTPLRAGAELLVYARRPPREVEDAWAQTRNVLRALRDEVLAHAARLLLVYVPSKLEVSDRDWRSTQELYGVDERDWDRFQVGRWLAEAGRDLQIPVLDLSAALRRQQRGSGQRTYHLHGGHWNQAGHATAALEVAARLNELRWLPACTRR